MASTATPSFASVPLSRGKVHTLPQAQPKPKPDPIQSLQRSGSQLPEPRPLGLPPPYNREQPPHLQHLRPTPIIRKNNYLDVHASSSLNKEKLRMHPDQHPIVTPRSLYFRTQKKKLHQEQIQEKNHLKQLQQQMKNETVYQPAAYAQGVGVPLLPSPTYTGFQQQPQHQSHAYIQTQPQLQQQQQSQQQYLYQQPHIRNFFQNPPPPSPHHGYSIGACPSGFQIPPESLSPTYQCASDPGNYQQQQQPVLATVYTNQVSLSQIEQFKAQLYSDVDYVIYPLKDPAISRQEYMDAKQGQVIATQAQHQQQQQQQQQQGSNCGFTYLQLPPGQNSPKLSPLYRSTPNVAGSPNAGGVLSSYPSYQSLASHSSIHQPGSSSGYSSMVRGRYFSQQSLASSLSSAPSGYSASTHSLSGSFDPYAEHINVPNPSVMRVCSDESILTSSGVTDSDVMSQQSGGQVQSPQLPRPPPPYRPKVRNNSKYV